MFDASLKYFHNIMNYAVYMPFEILIEMVALFAVAYYVEGRSREQCARRWEQLHPPDTIKGKWTKEEDLVRYPHTV